MHSDPSTHPLCPATHLDFDSTNLPPCAHQLHTNPIPRLSLLPSIHTTLVLTPERRRKRYVLLLTLRYQGFETSDHTGNTPHIPFVFILPLTLNPTLTLTVKRVSPDGRQIRSFAAHGEGAFA